MVSKKERRILSKTGMIDLEDGKQFLVFNRGRGVPTYVYTANLKGSDIRFLAKDSSHYEWRDPEHVLIWAYDGYRLYKDDGSGKNNVIWKSCNGHQTHLPGKEWIVTDTYPQGKNREQVVYLFHAPTGKKVELGRFHSPRSMETSSLLMENTGGMDRLNLV